MKRFAGSWMLAATLAMPVLAQSPGKAPTVLSLDFKADVQADGVPTNISPDPALPPALQALVRKRVAGWRYQVGTWQGQPVAGEVSQRIVAEAMPAASGGYALRIKAMAFPATTFDPKAMPGGLPPRAPPVYPPELRRRGVGGALVYAVRVDAQGRPQDIELVDPVQPDKDFKLLDGAARAAMAKWVMAPFKIDGVPVDCRQLIPISFNVGDAPAKAGPDTSAYRASHADICQRIPSLLTEVVGSML